MAAMRDEMLERARLLELESRRMKAEIRRDELREQMMSLQRKNSMDDEVERLAMERVRELMSSSSNSIDNGLDADRITRRVEEEAQRRALDITAAVRRQQDEAERKERVDKAVAKRIEEEAKRLVDEKRKADADAHALRVAADAPVAHGVRTRQISFAEGARPPPPFFYVSARDRADGGAEANANPVMVGARGAVDDSGSKGPPTGSTATASYVHHGIASFIDPLGAPVALTSNKGPTSAWSAPANDAAAPTFTILEVAAPHGPLGLVLYPYTIKVPILAKVAPIYCCIVHESAHTAAIKPGDVLVSVGSHTLLADDDQVPQGRGLVEACVKVLTTAPNPRRLRLYRSESVDSQRSESTLPPAEWAQLSPAVFSSGDGGQRLVACLEITAAAGAAADAARKATTAAPSAAAAGSSSDDSLTARIAALHRILDPSSDAPPAATGAPAPQAVPDAVNRPSSRVFEHMFRDAGPLGLAISPLIVSLEVAPGMQRQFWASVVTGNRSQSDPDQRIQVRHAPAWRSPVDSPSVRSHPGASSPPQSGDILLFVNSFLCLAEKSQARCGIEYGRAIFDVIASANVPKAIRFLRGFYIDADAPEGAYRLRFGPPGRLS